MTGEAFRPDELRTADVVVLGAGVAGLSAALHARGRDVVLVTKNAYAEGGSSVHAQGGVAAALAEDDSPEQHAVDTIAAGAGLCDPEVVRRVTADGPARIGELLQLGTSLDRRSDGSLALGREAAHRRHRVAHAAGDATGSEMVRALSAGVCASENIRIDQRVLALELVLDRGAVVGVMALDRQGCRILYVASEVVLAAGGVGALWRHTTNPSEVSGDGLAMAIRAGARVADLEFVQFHPTALAVDSAPMPLLTEALRGEGAVLVDRVGRRFMKEEHPDAELAPRDVVARAIWRRLHDGGEVFLDATKLALRVEKRFPTVVGLCRDRGFDLPSRPVPVAPAAHYHMGGVAVDRDGRTSVHGLWACGEVARTGLHGANRLASNSLLEALVYGAAVGDALATRCRSAVHPVRARDTVSRLAVPVAERPWLVDASDNEAELARKIRDVLWMHVGLERDAAGLQRAAADLAVWAMLPDRGLGELGNMALAARMIVRAAAARTESRGAHCRSDFPWTQTCWLQPLVFQGETMLSPHPVTAAAAGR
jgi:L-aspartate oxidase